ncbi:TPA: hypothetical protein L3F84_000750 [Enterobacter cloacae]|uniref:hypothetical protein n=1 Tax=Enterobacter cloacae TaxID=550 RepID=UPI000EF73290|nr:hypothetical protein [Enterobacter cloacae]MDE7904142.1 hypothetical protein [Enterobacter cloacae]MDK9968681.1 hypothetical protein [Enterobacter cloacae]MDK9973766.1 hypothetical protein [Enterobacter cloacae]MDL0011474.1 hypothetical protein [Enterobacter cloacae]RLS12343.1 hypothetical protein CKO00_25515 [Enterobacter cloacae]
MEFEKVEFVSAFYDDYCGEVFYVFDTIPKIGHGGWAISRGGDVAYDLSCDRLLQSDYPNELIFLTNYIPESVEIDGLED